MKKIMLFLGAMFIFFGCASTEVMQPVLKEKIEPVYPYEAKSRGIEGKVDLYLSVTEEGEVGKTTLLRSSGSDILDEASINYANRLKFQPATLKGKPIPVVVKWTINYKLEDVYWENGKVKILAFTKTAGLTHESTEQGKKTLKKLSEESNFDIEFSDNSELFTDEGLSNYNVIVFLNTSGDILNENQQNAFKKFMRNHGGFVGIHNAIDTELEWEWYTTLLGARIKNRPGVQDAVVRVMDMKHPSTKNLPYKWDRKDEFVDYSGSLSSDIRVLAVVDEKGEGENFHPFCWYHEFEGGRAWYTAGGHTQESFTDPVFIKHLIGGIKYAAGVE